MMVLQILVLYLVAHRQSILVSEAGISTPRTSQPRVSLNQAAGARVSYDLTAYNECLTTPGAILYGGGIIKNPNFDDGLLGWSSFGGCDLQVRHSTTTSTEYNSNSSTSNNKFLVATNRTASYSGPSQWLGQLTPGTMYSVSAWLQISDAGISTAAAHGAAVLNAEVKAVVQIHLQQRTVQDSISYKYVSAGKVGAKSGCWSFLKGGFSVDNLISLTDFGNDDILNARLYFETSGFTPEMELWVDGVSLQPFTKQEWRGHQRVRSKQLRRRRVSLHVLDEETGKRVEDAELTQVQATATGFKFGAAISRNILDDERYQNWFVERFNTAVFENELKWYFTEKEQGVVNYTIPDAMLAFCEQNAIFVRGHNVFWEDPAYQPPWLLPYLSASQDPVSTARQLAKSRLTSVVSRYAGHFRQWDVSNEQLHFSFFENALQDPAATARFFLDIESLDTSAQLFLNDFNTIENPDDAEASPDLYKAAVGRLISAGVDAGRLGIGLEAHFSNKPPNLPYMRAALDSLAELGLPIWLTELDVDVDSLARGNLSLAASYLEDVLLEALAHPAVNGVVLWTAIRANGRCWRMCLTDGEFHNLPAGDIVDGIIRQLNDVQVLEPRQYGSGYDGDDSAQSYIKWHGPVGTHRVSIRSRNSTFDVAVTVSPGNGTQHIMLRVPKITNKP